MEPEAYGDRSEWSVIEGGPPDALWPVIVAAYVDPLRELWRKTGIAMVPSARSCYRPADYEISRGRAGNSLHTFPPGSLGACDIRRLDGGQIEEVIDTVIEGTPFRRIALYPGQGFIHVDYGGDRLRSGSRRSLWLCRGPLQRWEYMSPLPGIVNGW